MRHHTDYTDGIFIPLSRSYASSFGRVFRYLEPFNPRTSEAENIAYFTRIAETMIDSPGTSTSGDNHTIPSGYTYFGQFVDHDITFDPSSSLRRQNDPNNLITFRTPCLDLDSLYGNGPAASPYLYEKDALHLIVGFAVQGELTGERDLQRNVNNTAIIGDPRNDESILISQMQLAFIQFHNRVVDEVIAASGFQGQSDQHRTVIFEAAQRIVRWHYQWVAINDFLRRITMPSVYNELIPNAGQPDSSRMNIYRFRNKPFIPVEFSVAAYRFGHSMVRSGYTLNEVIPSRESPRTLPLFDKQSPQNSLAHLGGSRQLPAVWSLNWSFFLDFGHKDTVQFSRLIDTNLVDPLADLPDTVVGSAPGEIRSLALRNLIRGWQMQIPSGQAVARTMGIPPALILPQVDFDRKGELDLPLWYYILNEAKIMTGGRTLGLVGSRLVAEIFIGLLTSDKQSYVNQHPLWTPQTSDLLVKIPSMGSEFELRDIITFSGLPTDTEAICAINNAGPNIPVPDGLC